MDRDGGGGRVVAPLYFSHSLSLSFISSLTQKPFLLLLNSDQAEIGVYGCMPGGAPYPPKGGFCGGVLGEAKGAFDRLKSCLNDNKSYETKSESVCINSKKKINSLCLSSSLSLNDEIR